MTLAEINRRIQKTDPLVELVRGEGYHYYIFDNQADRPVYEMESVMVPYLNHQEASVWIADGIEFGRRVRAENGL